MSAEAIKGANPFPGESRWVHPAIEIIKDGISAGVTFMGDDFIGYKFVGIGHGLHNEKLKEACEEEPFANINSKVLLDNGIEPVPFDSTIWNAY